MDEVVRKLPIPVEQLHYADPAVNDEAQSSPIRVLIDRVHYPTLGCPALLTPERTLDVVLSLPRGADATQVALSVVDRHGGSGEYPLAPAGAPESFGLGPPGKVGQRQAWLVRCDVGTLPHRLFDLHARWPGGVEVQHNAVRLYPRITGDERIVLCGDSQYHGLNVACLERFIDRVNARDDIAWVALIGDVCDNDVQGEMHVLSLAVHAGPGPVQCHYITEFHDVGASLLPRLNKPIVLVPGNHDGMAAYEQYERGVPTDAYLGPDARNQVAYDGLHYFRRTFGPLHFRFDWGRTRYLCLNSFELGRHDRLGYHAVVANWGGWMRGEQLAWMRREVAEAAERKMHTVILMHHDPRGGSEGRKLGYYHRFRTYSYDSLPSIVIDYLRYFARYARRWQQEWMRRGDDDLATHPVRDLLALLLDAKVWAVFMGHDNENWVESYFAGDGVFVNEPRHVEYPAADTDPVDPATVRCAAEMIEDGNPEGLERMLAGTANADIVLERAIEQLDARDYFKPAVTFAPEAVEEWRLAAKAPIHFVHVDDVGAYKHTRDEDFRAYGYVVADLREGRPETLQSIDLADGGTKESTVLSRE
jgi:hypothetical protein